jgi:hypothetical protein
VLLWQQVSRGAATALALQICQLKWLQALMLQGPHSQQRMHQVVPRPKQDSRQHL